MIRFLQNNEGFLAKLDSTVTYDAVIDPVKAKQIPSNASINKKAIQFS